MNTVAARNVDSQLTSLSRSARALIAGEATREWGIAVAIAAALAILLLLSTRVSTLWDRDEPRFAQAAVEMLASGRYLLPTFNDQLRTQKPILVYWLITCSLHLFGRTEFAVRCWSPVAMAVAALATFAIGRRLWSARVGRLAMVMLVLNPLAILEGQAATTDAVLLACITLSLALLVRMMLEPPPRASTALILGVVLGAGLLTKGPVALAVPIAIAVVAHWAGRREWPAGRLIVALTSSSIVALALYAAWLIPAAAASGGRFVTEGVVRENLLRAVVSMDGHGAASLAAVTYYPLVVVVGFAPWTLYLLAAIGARAPWPRERAKAIVTAWIAVPLIGFTLIATKLPHYILPIWPALALVSARAAETDLQGRLPGRFRSLGTAVLSTLICVEAAALVVIARIAAIDGLASAAIVSAGLLIAGFGAALALYARRSAAAALATMIGAVAVNMIWAAFALVPAFDRGKVVPPLAAAIRQSSAPVYAYDFAEPSLVFYGGRPVSELVGEQVLVDWAHRPGEALLVAPRRSIAAVERAHGPLGLRELASRWGWNYPKGQRLEVVAFIRQAVR